jgi:hypothetical protein
MGGFLDYFGRKPPQFLGPAASHMRDKRFARRVGFLVWSGRDKCKPLATAALKDRAVE